MGRGGGFEDPISEGVYAQCHGMCTFGMARVAILMSWGRRMPWKTTC